MPSSGVVRGSQIGYNYLETIQMGGEKNEKVGKGIFDIANDGCTDILRRPE
jgi:hypothetical protein